MELFFGSAYCRIFSQGEINMANVRAVIDQIGILYKNDYPDSHEKSYKLGVRKVYDKLGQKVSKKQIKRFINLGTETRSLIERIYKRNVIRIPYKSMMILNAIVEIVDDDEKLRNYCKSQCENCVNKKDTNYCREKLILSFYYFVMVHSNQLSKNERAEGEILEPMRVFKVECN